MIGRFINERMSILHLFADLDSDELTRSKWNTCIKAATASRSEKSAT